MACTLLNAPFLPGLRPAEVCWWSWHGRHQNTDHLPWPRPRPYCSQNDQHCHQGWDVGSLTELPPGHKLDACSGEDLWGGDRSRKHPPEIQVRRSPTPACLWVPTSSSRHYAGCWECRDEHDTVLPLRHGDKSRGRRPIDEWCCNSAIPALPVWARSMEHKKGRKSWGRPGGLTITWDFEGWIGVGQEVHSKQKLQHLPKQSCVLRY